jgi:hypothetical protein
LNRTKSVFGGLALAMMIEGVAIADTPTVPTDLVTHNEVVIKGSPAKIWPLVIEPNSWKKGPKMISLDGPAGQLGERLKGVMSNGHIAFYAENVEVEPQHRRTIRLNTAEGRLLGFATWQLTLRGTDTLVQYDVYSQVPLAIANETPAQIAAAKKDYHDSNSQRFAEELVALKKLVEGS